MASDEDVAEAVGEQEDEQPIRIQWNLRTPSVSQAIDTLFSLGIVLYGLYVYGTSTGWFRWLALGFAGVFALVGTLRLYRWYIRRSTTSVAEIEMEVAAEQHPDGCMCPFCVKHRMENGLEVNPHD